MKFKTTNGWTKEKMIEHIKKEFKGKSVNPVNEKCLYRGPDGAKCAMGMFIPDSEYDQRMDDSDGNDCIAQSILEIFPSLRINMPLTDHGMRVLQLRHDRSDSNEKCLNEMLKFIEDEVENGDSN